MNKLLVYLVGLALMGLWLAVSILIIIGIVLVRSKSRLDGLGGWSSRRSVTLLPLASAVIVTVLGLGNVIKGRLPYYLRG